MKLRSWLPFIAAAVLFVTPLPAQQSLPKSTQEQLAASARVEVLTPGEFKTLLFQAQSGDREAQYLLALICGDGLLVPRDLAAAFPFSPLPTDFQCSAGPVRGACHESISFGTWRLWR